MPQVHTSSLWSMPVHQTLATWLSNGDVNSYHSQIQSSINTAFYIYPIFSWSNLLHQIDTCRCSCQPDLSKGFQIFFLHKNGPYMCVDTWYVHTFCTKILKMPGLSKLLPKNCLYICMQMSGLSKVLQQNAGCVLTLVPKWYIFA